MDALEAHRMIEAYCCRTFEVGAVPPAIVKALNLAERDGAVTPEIRSLCDPYREPFNPTVP